MARKKRRINRKKQIRNLSILILIPLLVIVLFVSNFTRLRLWIKGYSLDAQKILLELDKEDVKEYLSLDHVIDISAWDAIENDHHYVEYEFYMKNKKASKEESIEYVDQLNIIKEDLMRLGYPLEKIRAYMLRYSVDDFQEIVDSQYTYESIQEYLDVKGCQVQDILEYKKSDEFDKKAILDVSYPFIDSRVEKTRDYQIQSPSDYLVLIKNGFYVSEDYEPKDLVKTNLAVSDDAVSNLMRKKAADALEKMASAASKKGYDLVINSAYRSYADQKAVYDEYFRIYDPVTAASLVAIPGCSEHQLGLSVDLISQSVLDGKYGVFGESPDYRWTVKHAHEYGFILRYPEDKTSMTGTANEPWHFRYVGVSAATEMVEENLTLEEYVLKHGFTYDLTIR